MCTFRTKLLCSSKTIHRIFIFSRGGGSIIANFVPNFVAMATGVDGRKCDWQHSMARPRKPPYRRKNFAKISYASRFKANFVPNFVDIAMGVGRGKMQLAAFDGSYPKNPLWTQKSRRYLLHGPSYSQFCPKFRCHCNEGRSGKNAIGSIRWPIPENPYIGAKISYTSRVIANFVQILLQWQPGRVQGKIK